MKTVWRTGGLLALALVVLAWAESRPLPAADGDAGPSAAEVRAVLDKATAFLKTRQNDDGSFAPKLGGPGVSALVAAGLIRNGKTTDDPLVAKTMGYLEKKIKKDGGIYDKGLANYTTSVALMAFHEGNKNGKYDTVLKNGSQFLKSLQFTDVDDHDLKSGGVGYDGKERPDLSNTQFFVEALLAAGVPKSDPAVQKALRFISRCQNLAGEHNDQPFAKKATDDDKGGFTYNPAVSDKNRTPAGGLRSEGAMTYAGLKSFLHAGVSKDDPRVKAAVDWIGRHYTVEEHPGQGQAGLYYYYQTFGKALAALDQDYIVDAAKQKHDWRKDLFEALKKRQKADGSWSNANKAFQENNPELATAFAVLTLSYCQKAKK